MYNDMYNKYYKQYMYYFLIILKIRYDNNVRISSNSWGASNVFSYDSYCSLTDKFVWDYNDMVILFSAGNYGGEGYFNVTWLIIDSIQLLLLV